MKNIWSAIVLCVFIACTSEPGKSVNKAVDTNDSAGHENKDKIDTEATSVHIVDSATIKKLSKHFLVKGDEFSEIKSVYHKTSPQYVNRNGIFLYFQERKQKPVNLRFVIQYLADDWLFIQGAIFNVDGTNINYEPSKMDRDNGDGSIWEWSDEWMDDSEDMELLKAFENAKTIKVKFIGQQYSDTKNLTTSQVQALKDVIVYYQAKGGKLNNGK